MQKTDIFEDPERRPRPLNENEMAAVLLTVESCLITHNELAQGTPPQVAALTEALPSIWLALAQAAATVVEKDGRPAVEQVQAELAHRFLHHALRQSQTAETLHAAAKVLIDLGAADLTVEEAQEERGVGTPAAEEEEAPDFLKEAVDYLEAAARLGPAQPQILSELSRALLLRIYRQGADKVSLLRDALRHGEEALGCYGEANRYIDGTRILHPVYLRSLMQTGTARRLLASHTEDARETRALLTEACRQMRSAVDGGLGDPQAEALLREAEATLGSLEST